LVIGLCRSVIVGWFSQLSGRNLSAPHAYRAPGRYVRYGVQAAPLPLQSIGLVARLKSLVLFDAAVENHPR
jgi:hypothetical protein